MAQSRLSTVFLNKSQDQDTSHNFSRGSRSDDRRIISTRLRCRVELESLCNSGKCELKIQSRTESDLCETEYSMAQADRRLQISELPKTLSFALLLTEKFNSANSKNLHDWHKSSNSEGTSDISVLEIISVQVQVNFNSEFQLQFQLQFTEISLEGTLIFWSWGVRP